MAGKQDPRRNFGTVGDGSAPAEKVEAEEGNFRTGAVLLPAVPLPIGWLGANQADSMSSLMLKKADSVCGATLMPCTGSRTATEEGKKADLVYGGSTLTAEEAKDGSVSGGLWPCTGGHTPTEEVKADRFPGGLKARSGSHISSESLEKENKEKDRVASAKRKAKAEGSEGECGGGKSAGVDEMAEAAGAGDAKAAEIKWVEMPLEYIAWLLSQKWEDYTVRTLEDHTMHRTGSNTTAHAMMYTQEEFDEHREMILKSQATDEAGREEFFAFQAWVRETFEQNGCVMVPEDSNGPNPCGNQDVIDEIWEQGKHELGL